MYTIRVEPFDQCFGKLFSEKIVCYHARTSVRIIEMCYKMSKNISSICSRIFRVQFFNWKNWNVFSDVDYIMKCK